MPKDLRKLAKLCRSLGITHYKCADFEFTLSDYIPESNYKKAVAKTKKSVVASSSDLIEESDNINNDALLFWSVTDAEVNVKVNS